MEQKDKLREKIAKLITGEPSKMLDGTDDPLHEMDIMNNLELADQIIALFPDECATCDTPLLREGELYQKLEEARKQLLEEIESHFSATNYHSPEAGKGLVNSIDVEDWQALKEEK